MIRLERLDPTGDDHDALVDFLTRNAFPFHVRRSWTQDDARKAIADRAFRDSENDTFWLIDGDENRIGFVRLEDLEDPTPLFDLRLDQPYRGQGLGASALRSITDHVFETMPSVTRFEGQTREDNVAMRRVFLRCGWVKEAHYRESWPVDGGHPVASVAYAILRRDWETGETTPVEWDDLSL